MDTMKLVELRQLAKEKQINGYSKMTKTTLINVLSDKIKPSKSIARSATRDVFKKTDIEQKSVSDNIDWDTLLRNTTKQKLIDYAKGKCSAKMTKQEILDEILFSATKQIFIDLSK